MSNEIIWCKHIKFQKYVSSSGHTLHPIKSYAWRIHGTVSMRSYWLFCPICAKKRPMIEPCGRCIIRNNKCRRHNVGAI